MIPEGRLIISGNDKISFERCALSDIDFIEYVMDTGDIKKWFSEDGEDRVDYRSFFDAPGIYIVKILLYGNPIGLFFISVNGRVLIDIQTAILSPYRGRYSVEAAQAGMEWLFTNTECNKIITHVPRDNIKSYALSKKAGMRIIGIIRKSYLRNGKLHDQYLLGITKAQFLKEALKEERSNG